MKNLSKLCLLFSAIAIGSSSGQLLSADVKADNLLMQGGVPTPTGPPVLAGSQFSGVAPMSSSVGPANAYQHLNANTISTTHLTSPPPLPPNGGHFPTDGTLTLQESTVGFPVASGIPRYFMGAVCVRPELTYDSNGVASPSYWRAEPLQAGEILPLFDSSGASITNPNPTIPQVTVDASSTLSTSITLSGVIPSELKLGAILLGQPISNIIGSNTVVLGGNANVTINTPTTVDLIPKVNYYYSKHAERVYASEPGLVEVMWVTSQPVDGVNYGTKMERFVVSANAVKETQTIFWTESGFDGPIVEINDSRIVTANPIYNTYVPKAVADEIDVPGSNNLTQNLKTIYYEKFNGVGNLKAYNVEGRILVEYLGEVREGNDIHDFVGIEIVDVFRVPQVYKKTVHLGTRITPHNEDLTLFPAPTQSTLINYNDRYATQITPAGLQTYYAEKITGEPNAVENFEPLDESAYNEVIMYWLREADYSIRWPQFKNRYWNRWSPFLDADYVHHTVGPNGSEADTGVSFSRGDLPQVIYQDDPNQSEARIDLTTQSFQVTFDPVLDKVNRTLIKFTSPDDFWYQAIYTQGIGDAITAGRDYPSYAFSEFDLGAEGDRISIQDGSSISIEGLEIGMLLVYDGVSEPIKITGFSGTDTILFDTALPSGITNFSLIVEPDHLLPIDANAYVGDRIPNPVGYEVGGFVKEGQGYNPNAYVNPFISGLEAAGNGAIIPVNVLPNDDKLVIRWFKKVQHPSGAFADYYVPGKLGTYQLQWPSAKTWPTPEGGQEPVLTLANGEGTSDLLAELSQGTVYVQNDPNATGYNPNEEHSFIIGTRGYSLRDDLNVLTGSASDYTSAPYFLLEYTSATDDRPMMKAFRVERGDFTYDAVAGTVLNLPYPLPLMDLPLDGSGNSLNREILPLDAPLNTSFNGDANYSGFTFNDRNGFTWVHRGPHDGATQYDLKMKLYYTSRDGFYIPKLGQAGQVLAAGVNLPHIRELAQKGTQLDFDNDEPIEVVYNPTWPTEAPVMKIGETLALPKFGLPQIRGQKSVDVAYQQSLALDATNTPTDAVNQKWSVRLHDPTREKTYVLDGVTLDSLPDSTLTTSYQGQTYFQNLPPHLQSRFYFDPLRGVDGTLVLLGEFHDEIAGEDYFDLNVLSLKDVEDLKALVANADVEKSAWDTAVESLVTSVEQFIEDPLRPGSYVSDGLPENVGYDELAFIEQEDMAVDSYALTALGQGSGWVTLVMGNGEAFTPTGDPVQVQIIRVEEDLYVGDLKVLYSDNPLNEKVVMKHSGDFAARPQDYEFEWAWSPGLASAPQTYSTTYSQIMAQVGSWSALLAPDQQRPPFTYPAIFNDGGSLVNPLFFPRSASIKPSAYTVEKEAAGYPSLVIKNASPVDFSSVASEVPADMVFTAKGFGNDGFVLYVNGVEALAYQAPVDFFSSVSAQTGLVSSLHPLQFKVSNRFFNLSNNTIEVALYPASTTNVGDSLNPEFGLHYVSQTETVTTSTDWQIDANTHIGANTVRVGGLPSELFGGPQFVINDRWFTMRYRPLINNGHLLASGSDQSQVEWSTWMSPMLVEGWVKRVLAAINPFQQRVTDLFSNSVNTDVSVLTQAGAKWEGDIALTLDNINDAGLIEIYETVLNRARAITIDANVNDPDSNNALLLAAGYLNDLYTLLGNEAFADAANPTISLETLNGASEVNTSRFSFESQVASSLDEELALLRGRDDFVSPGVRVGPAYNRLYWNYTRGIDSGEVIYATNYNIREQADSDAADGVIDEVDAQRMFPQGHGDAYGHFLTAIKGYYNLMRSPNFTWTPRAESVTVLGQPVTIDYQDERKFASAATNLGKTAQQVINLTYRQQYSDDPNAGWAHFSDQTSTNASSGVQRRQGLDDWVSRSAQGAFYNWVVGNAMLPAEDNFNTGVQKIDRTTVPELTLLTTQVTEFQTTVDNANAHLNPLGLSPYAVAFDISPADLKNGKGHFEQVYERSLNALNNAAGAFNQAAVMSRSLRSQENQLDEYNTEIFEQEFSYKQELIEIFGQPYDGNVGVGKVYVQGYDGPDLVNWFIVDRPTNLSDVGSTFDIQVLEPVAQDFSFLQGNYSGTSYSDTSLVLSLFNLGTDTLMDPTDLSTTVNANDIVGSVENVNDQLSETLLNGIDNTAEGLSVAADFYLRNDQAGTYNKLTVDNYKSVGVTVVPSQFVQYNDTWKDGGLGGRPETGELQEALLDAQKTWLQLADYNGGYQDSVKDFENSVNLFQEQVILHQLIHQNLRGDNEQELIAATVTSAMEFASETVEALGDETENIAESVSEALPTSVGFSTDATAPARGAIELTGAIVSAVSKAAEITLNAGIRAYKIYDLQLGFELEEMMQVLEFDQEARTIVYDLQADYKAAIGMRDQLAGIALEHHRALQRVKNVLAKGNRLLAERELFRKRAASVIQGYRTNDISFRLFRNEALEQYRSLYDLAARYSYLAAKSYDYETGLLGTTAGQSVFNDIVSSRALGDLSGGVPQATTSTLGDSGLAGTMARLLADYSVAEGRLGINNPDQNGTAFSLRGELFRILNVDGNTDQDALWQQTLEQHIHSDITSDEDVASLCSNIGRDDGRLVPGFIIPFTTSIRHGENFFGRPLAGGDHSYSASNYATKIYSVGISFPGYVGMDTYSNGGIDAIAPNTGDPNGLSATPYVYLIPAGQDVMIAPPLGDTGQLRQWFVDDQALPLPFNLGASDFNANQFFRSDGTLSEQPWITRKHNAFRAVDNIGVFYSRVPDEFGSSRLIGRSVWNTQWKLVIPAYTLLNDEEDGLNRFVDSVDDVQLFFRTYSNSGN